MLIILPEHKLGVVVLANSSTSGSVVNKVAAETIKPALEAKTGIKQPGKQAVLGNKGSLSPTELSDYEGRYATFAGVVPVTKKADHLQAELMGRSLRLAPGPDGLLGSSTGFSVLSPSVWASWTRSGSQGPRLSAARY